MWRIIAAQLRYSRFWIAAAILVAGGLTMFGALAFDRPSKLADFATLGVFIGIMLGVYLWLRDVKERRAIVWVALPVRPGAWLGARLWMPVLLTVGFLAVQLGGWLVREMTAGDLPFAGWAAEVVRSYGLLLMVLVLFPFSEEVNIYLRNRKWALFLFNALSIVGLMTWVVLGAEGALSFALVTYGTALAAAMVTVWIYRRRNSFLVVSHPVHGLPQDLASSEGRFSTR